MSARDVLVVEDDKVDIMAVRRAFRRRGLEERLCIAQNGEAALVHVRAAPDPPALVVVDLALPRMSGLELLAEFRADPDLEPQPACVLSTSRNPPEMELAASLGALAIFNKEDMGADYVPLFELLAELDRSAGSPKAGAS